MQQKDNTMGIVILLIASCFLVLVSGGVIWYGNREGWFGDLFGTKDKETNPPAPVVPPKEESKSIVPVLASSESNGRKVYIYADKTCSVYEGSGWFGFLSNKVTYKYITLNDTNEDHHNLWRLESTEKKGIFRIIDSEGKYLAVDSKLLGTANIKYRRLRLNYTKTSSTEWKLYTGLGPGENMYAIESVLYPDHFIIRGSNICQDDWQPIVMALPKKTTIQELDDDRYMWHIEDKDDVNVGKLIEDRLKKD